MKNVAIMRDAIGGVLREPELARREEVASLAEAYAAACAEAADRLQRCAQYLDRGMRSEAVHLAGCPPDLARLAASLRLPDAAAWEALCVRHGQPRPPRLPLEVVERLTAAVREDRRLAPVLGRLRVLTLARAPLAERIAALRAVRAADADNSLWAEELRRLEGARMEQLRVEAELALAGASDAARLTALLEELESPEWLTPPNEHVVSAVRDRLAAVREEQELAQLPLGELRDAYKRLAFEECTGLLERWQAVTEQNQLELPEAVQERVRPIIAWVAAESRRRTLEHRRDLAAASLGQPMSPAAGGRPLGRRRRFLLVMVAVSLLAAAGAAVWWGVLR